MSNSFSAQILHFLKASVRVQRYNTLQPAVHRADLSSNKKRQRLYLALMSLNALKELKALYMELPASYYQLLCLSQSRSEHYRGAAMTNDASVSHTDKIIYWLLSDTTVSHIEIRRYNKRAFL